MDKKAWIIFSAVVVLIFGGLIYLSGKNKIDVSSIDGNRVAAASEENGNIADHTYGKKDSKVILIEYGDFQCPGCGGAHPHIKALTEEYKDKILFVYRNFPLTNIHPNAKAAAAAVEAAGLQGKYWPMHNIVFESQDSWKDTSTSERDTLFAQYAEQVGADKDKFLQALSDTAISRKISFDQALGKKAGVSGTPTLFLNGTKVSDEITDGVIKGNSDKLKDLIDRALK